MDLLELQLAEMEMLQSTFEEELKIETPTNLDELQCLITNGELVSLGLIYTLNLSSFNLWISLPDLYPKIGPTIMISTKGRCDDKRFQSALDEKICEIVERDTDELVVMEVIAWVEENIENFKNEIKQHPVDMKDVEIEFHRIWVYSHHIYSSEKRRNMAAISHQLDLTGFILPGKPGIICVEGESKKVHQFYTQIKR